MLGVMVFRSVLVVVESNLIKTTSLWYRLQEFPAPAAGTQGYPTSTDALFACPVPPNMLISCERFKNNWAEG